MPALNPNGGPVDVSGVTLRTPGLRGEARLYRPADPGRRGAEAATPELDAALENAGMRPAYTIELTNTREMRAPAGSTRSTTFGEPAIELEVPARGEQWGQLVLAIDESGVVTWNFPVESKGRVRGTRGGPTKVNRYVIRRYVPRSSARTGTRGVIGTIGKKVLKVLVFPIVEKVAGKVSDFFAGKWEAANRPYRVRVFGPDDYQKLEAGLVEGERWGNLSEGRALLFLHGTFSRAHSGFGRFQPGVFSTLHNRYGGRLFAFDHYTLSEDPIQNVEHLLRQIPDGTNLELDIVCHSRGGLVGRVLAERQGELSLGSRSLRVRRVIFTATPNAGTILASADHYATYVDTMTNLLQFLPDNGVTDILDTVITVVKHLAVGALNGLDGLQSMCPGGSFLEKLNQGATGETKYFALASNYEPANEGWKRLLQDRVRDVLFLKANDLVVPTTGVYEANGSGRFPIADRLEFAADKGVAHSEYFGNPAAVDRILTWLGD